MSGIYKYDLGMVCGRFNHVHKGHEGLFDTALDLCKRVCILVGSAQEFGTLRNPFSVETRIDLISQIYPEQVSSRRLIIRGLNDLTNEYDVNSNWGKYVKKQTELKMKKFCDLMIYGNDEFRSDWFDKADLQKTMEMIIPRALINISATKIRGFMLMDMESEWQKWVNPFIHSEYNRLREELLEAPVYEKIYNEIRKKEFDMNTYMLIYKKYENEYKSERVKED